MAYEPTVWECGDTITAEKLNKLEEAVANAGGGGEMLIVNGTVTIDGNCQITTLDKTWQEIYDAFPNVLISTEDPVDGQTILDSVARFIRLTNGGVSKNGYGIETVKADFTANSSSDYPKYKYCGDM